MHPPFVSLESVRCFPSHTTISEDAPNRRNLGHLGCAASSGGARAHRAIDQRSSTQPDLSFLDPESESDKLAYAGSPSASAPSSTAARGPCPMPVVQSKLVQPWTHRGSRPAAIAFPLLVALYYLRKKLLAAATERSRQSASWRVDGQGGEGATADLGWLHLAGDRAQLTTPQIELAQRDLYRQCVPHTRDQPATLIPDLAGTPGSPMAPANSSSPIVVPFPKSSSTPPSRAPSKATNPSSPRPSVLALPEPPCPPPRQPGSV